MLFTIESDFGTRCYKRRYEGIYCEPSFPIAVNEEILDVSASTSKDIVSSSEIVELNMPTNAAELVKKCVIWPEKKTNTTSRKREYIPSVLTSDKWKDIMMAKEKEKDRKEEQKQIKLAKKINKNIKKKKPTIEISETSEEENLRDTSHSDCEDWIPQVKPSGFEELDRTPLEGDYVLVEFKNPKATFYYVGKILRSKDEDNKFEISYLRKHNTTGSQFTMPQIPDLASVAEIDIKMILPPALFTGTTKRQNSFYTFEIELSGLYLR